MEHGKTGAPAAAKNKNENGRAERWLWRGSEAGCDAVVPAKAGTHTPRLIDVTRSS
jgi:hypothetical protein